MPDRLAGRSLGILVIRTRADAARRLQAQSEVCETGSTWSWRSFSACAVNLGWIDVTNLPYPWETWPEVTGLLSGPGSLLLFEYGVRL